MVEELKSFHQSVVDDDVVEEVETLEDDNDNEVEEVEEEELVDNNVYNKLALREWYIQLFLHVFLEFQKLEHKH